MDPPTLRDLPLSCALELTHKVLSIGLLLALLTLPAPSHTVEPSTDRDDDLDRENDPENSDLVELVLHEVLRRKGRIIEELAMAARSAGNGSDAPFQRLRLRRGQLAGLEPPADPLSDGGYSGKMIVTYGAGTPSAWPASISMRTSCRLNSAVTQLAN